MNILLRDGIKWGKECGENIKMGKGDKTEEKAKKNRKIHSGERGVIERFCDKLGKASC